MNKVAPYVLIAVVAVAAYGAILVNGAGFSHPDDGVAAQMRCVIEGINAVPGGSTGCNFRPLVALTYQVNQRFGGWMLTNLGFHILAGFLVYSLAGSLSAAVLFSVHPMAADAVASVAGRSAVLLAVSALGAVCLIRRWKWLSLPGFAILAGTAGFNPDYFNAIPRRPEIVDHVARYFSALGSYVIPRAFIPLQLSADPDIRFSAVFLVFGVLVAVLAIGAAISLRRTPWAAGFLLLTLPLIPYALVPLPDVFLEHRAYLSLAGVSILLACALKTFKVAQFALVGLFMLLSVNRSFVYASPIALWQDAAQASPNKGRPHNNLAGAYARAGLWKAAQFELERAIAVEPEISMAWQNLATLHMLQGRMVESNRVLDAHNEFLKGNFNGF